MATPSSSSRTAPLTAPRPLDSSPISPTRPASAAAWPSPPPSSATARTTTRPLSRNYPGARTPTPAAAPLATPWSGNARRFETHTALPDTVSVTHGPHPFTAGARADIVRLRADLRDGSQGFFVFPTLAALQTGNASFFTRSFGNTA